MKSYRWIPWAFAGALGVVVAANGALAYFAAVSSTGLVTEHPFDRGNSYNRVLDAAATQDALGWRAAVSFRPAGLERGEIAAKFTDRDGRPLPGLRVTARVQRPVEPLPESVVPLSETAAGRYVAAVALDRPGQWEVHIAARLGADRFEFTQRIAVQ